jgi:hypothetical protein
MFEKVARFCAINFCIKFMSPIFKVVINDLIENKMKFTWQLNCKVCTMKYGENLTIFCFLHTHYTLQNSEHYSF